MKRLMGFTLFAVVLLAADGLVKWAVNAYLPPMTGAYPYGGIGLFSNFLGIQASIIHTINTGAVWGSFSGYQGILLVVRIAIILGLVIYLIGFHRNRATLIPFTMIVAGAIGNVVDFFIYGHVVDMIYFRFWGWSYPVFNLADTFIFIGVAWLLLYSFFQRQRPAEVKVRIDDDK